MHGAIIRPAHQRAGLELDISMSLPLRPMVVPAAPILISVTALPAMPVIVPLPEQFMPILMPTVCKIQERTEYRTSRCIAAVSVTRIQMQTACTVSRCQQEPIILL